VGLRSRPDHPEAHEGDPVTPEQITGLSALLLEARDFIRETDPGALDAELLDAAVDALARLRAALVGGGAQ